MTGPAPLLDRLGRISPYFALGTEAPGSGWIPVEAVTGRTEAGESALAAAIGNVGVRLGGPPPWVAASILQLGWAARLTSIYAGSIVLAGVVPDLSAARLQLRLGASGPVELVADPVVLLEPDAAWRALWDGHLRPLAEAVRARVRIGARALDGNAASAMAGSLGAIERAGLGRRAELAQQPWAQPPDLAGLGRWLDTGFRRTTCCGYLKVPGGGRCGDCSLDRP